MPVRVEWDGAKFRQVLVNAAEIGIEQLAMAMVDEIKISMKGPRTGKKYKRLRYRSSAPGEPPAVQTGSAGLLGSIHNEASGEMSQKVGSSIEKPDYALYLEVGTKFMEPRPYLRPALQKFTGRASTKYFDNLLKETALSRGRQGILKTERTTPVKDDPFAW